MTKVTPKLTAVAKKMGLSQGQLAAISKRAIQHGKASIKKKK